MKNIFLLIVLVALTACDTSQFKYGQGGINACQYVREQMQDQSVNIKNIEVIREDSVLSPLIILIGKTEIYKKSIDLYDGLIANKQWQEYIDSMVIVGYDVQRSWIMDKRDCDSLKQLSKYHGSWRKAYIVEVTMKSNTSKQYRVCMNEDGVTPSMTAEEYLKEQKEYERALSE